MRTLAALADAHDEHMLLVRLADGDRLDAVDFQEELHRSGPICVACLIALHHFAGSEIA